MRSASRGSFRGYGPEQGYDFLRHAIAENDYRSRGLDVTDDEIFVSDGSKCDCANILDVFGDSNRIAVMDPVYPVYVDTNVMIGHTGPADEAGIYSGLLIFPAPPRMVSCLKCPTRAWTSSTFAHPNNPTGAVATREHLESWVSFALAHEAIILYDAAYEAYIGGPDIPHSIYEIPGARRCAIEFRSFSKNGGFTGVRCAFTVVPSEIECRDFQGEKRPLHPLWNRRFSTKFNGVSYVTQRAAEALYSPDGKSQVASLVSHYMGNAKILREAVTGSGLAVYGGVDAPYIWVRGPADVTSWQVFDRVLNEANVVITPGSGFGGAGEGFFRISAFNSRANAEEAARRFASLKWS